MNAPREYYRDQYPSRSEMTFIRVAVGFASIALLTAGLFAAFLGVL